MSFPEFGTLVEEVEGFPQFGTLVEEKPVSTKEAVAETGVEALKGLGRTVGRGAISLSAAPSKAIGGLFSLLAKAGDENLPGNKLYVKLGQYFSNLGEEGQKYLKSQLEETLGESYGSGEEALSQFVERAGDLFGRAPVAGMVVPSLIGGAAGQVAKEAGLPEGAQTIAEFAGLSAKDVLRGIDYLKNIPIKSKSGLTLPKVVDVPTEKLKKIGARVLPGRKEQTYKSISDQSKDLIKDIEKKQIPISQEVEKGVDITARNEENLKKVYSVAEKLPTKTSSDLVSSYLDDVESKIKFGGVPTPEEEDILKSVDKFRELFGSQGGAVRMFSPSQYLKQFRNINKSIGGLYETQFLHGKRLDTMKFYEGLKDSIKDTLEVGTPKEFFDLFEKSNKDYSQSSRLERFQSIMESVTNPEGLLDSAKLYNIFKSPRKTDVLYKQIGKEGVDRLRTIAKDLHLAKTKLDSIKTIGLGDLLKSAVTGSVLTFLKIPFGKTGLTAAKAINLGRGYLLTSDRGARDTANFLKAIRSGNKKAITSTFTKLDQGAKEYEEEDPSSVAAPD